MSTWETWWRNRTGREKSMLLLLLLLINASLFLHWELFATPLSHEAVAGNAAQAAQPAPPPVESPALVAATPSKAQPAATQRDPFRPPAGLSLKTAAPQRASNAPPPAAAQPQHDLAPPLVLTGVLAGENGARFAIIEAYGASRYYKLHDKLGDYIVSDITDHAVRLSGPEGQRLITLRR